jgi:peroxiredoxin
MSLKDNIEEFKKQFLAQVPEDIQKIMLTATDELKQSNLEDQCCKTGDKAPDFSLPNIKGDKLILSELLDKGPVVLSFYRGGWCPYCNLELKALQESLPEIETSGGQLVAVSPQLPDHSLSAAETNEISFEVLSDVGNHTARKYGLVFTLKEELRPIYKKWGADIASVNGDDSFELPIPATFVINSNGIITYSFVDADYTNRLEPAKIIEALG